MRHRKHRFSLGRKKEHRTALMANLSAALLRHGRIQTTLVKAKALRPEVERVITLAKKAQNASPERALHLRRQAIARVRDKDAVALLFNERASEFMERPGGYTRIYKLGTRIGDAAEMALIQLIPAEDTGYDKPKRRRSGKRSSVKAATATAAAASSTATAETATVAAPEEGAEAPAEAEAPANTAEAPEPAAEATEGSAAADAPDDKAS